MDFDPQSGMLDLQGVSMPENVLEFYAPLLAWMRDYFAQSQQKTEFHIRLNYFNTATSKILLEFFNLLEQQNIEHGTDVSVHWHYDEEDLDTQEAGQDYKYLLVIPFNLVPYEHTPPVS